MFTLNASNDPGVNLLAIVVSQYCSLFEGTCRTDIYQSNVIDWMEVI